MTSPRILLALHRGELGSGLADGLPVRGLRVEVSRNMAETWVLVRKNLPDAVLLAPLSREVDSAEFSSLLALAASPGGPAILVVTDDPGFLEGRIDAVDDYLHPGMDPDLAARRVRFALARKAAIARLQSERASLLRQTITDFKTGLFNDRYFAERSREEVSRARRGDQPIGVLMIDFDGFKAINDVHGHPFGDHALTTFADCLRHNLRDFDVAARVGGDEFAVLLPGSHLEDATGIAERIRATVGSLTIEHEGRRAALSVSIGVAAWTPASEASLDATVRGADKALLQAKGLGPGRICLHDRDVVRPHTLGGKSEEKRAKRKR
jgi:diguanylate cyclase (GGDEF)-like protein